MVFGDVLAAEPFHSEPISQSVPAFAANGLPLARGEGVEKILETGIAAIVPVELCIYAAEPVQRNGEICLRLGHESQMDRGGLQSTSELLGGVQQHGAGSDTA